MTDVSVSGLQLQDFGETRLTVIRTSGDKLFSSLMQRLEQELDVLVESVELATAESERAALRARSNGQRSSEPAASGATSASPGGVGAGSPQTPPVGASSSGVGHPSGQRSIGTAGARGYAGEAGYLTGTRVAPLHPGLSTGATPALTRPDPLTANAAASASSNAGADPAELSHSLARARRAQATAVRSAAGTQLSVVVSAGEGLHDVEVTVRLRNANGDERDQLREGLRREMARLGLVRYRTVVDGVDLSSKGGFNGN